MAYVDFNDDIQKISGANDAIVLIKDLADIPAGVVLDVTNVPSTEDVIKAGHIIVQNKTTKLYSPLSVSEDNYVLPTEELPTAAESSQTSGQAISGTVYEGVEKGTEGAVKCAKADGTVVYLSGTAATGTASSEKTYYTKDTTNKTSVEDDNVAFVGVLKQTITTAKPLGAVTTIGEINAAACPYSVTDAIVAKLPHINFLYR